MANRREIRSRRGRSDEANSDGSCVLFLCGALVGANIIGISYVLSLQEYNKVLREYVDFMRRADANGVEAAPGPDRQQEKEGVWADRTPYEW